ncbi:MAG: hypothetical protein J5614_08225 [Paludibacteraceae bacterium]|nr:hypothetical protein [Paludibacteraceae bacterium]MCR5193682.1 hypothetical protein [Bacteroidales bacterium]
MRNLKVIKEHYMKDDKEYNCYCLRGVVRGKDVRVQLLPPDIQGYTLLDIVFGEDNEADFIVTPFEFKDDKGNVIAGNSYSVRSIGDQGEIYECKVIPAKVSDKTLIALLLRD